MKDMHYIVSARVAHIPLFESVCFGLKRLQCPDNITPCVPTFLVVKDALKAQRKAGKRALAM